MFGNNRSISQVRGVLGAISLIGASTGLAGPALAGAARDVSPPPQMALGAAAVPPGGFLDFCQRSPQDCADPSDEHTDIAAVRAEALRSFWKTAFSRSSTLTTHTRPASLGGPAVTGFGRTARYDWSEVSAFRTTALASPAPTATSVAGKIDAVSSNETFSSNTLLALVTALSADTVGPAAVDEAAPAVVDAPKTADDMVVPVPSLAPLLLPQTTRTLDPVPPSTTTADGVAQADAGLAQPVATTRPFSLDRAGWRLVNGVNRRINRQIRRAVDAKTYGEEDYWTVPQGKGGRGDCEDFVLAKRRALIDLGVPAAALSIAIVQTKWGESHAVLLVAAEQGEYVLDSLTPWISRWDRVNYVWRERQRPGRPFDWVQAAI